MAAQTQRDRFDQAWAEMGGVWGDEGSRNAVTAACPTLDPTSAEHAECLHEWALYNEARTRWEMALPVLKNAVSTGEIVNSPGRAPLYEVANAVGYLFGGAENVTAAVRRTARYRQEALFYNRLRSYVLFALEQRGCTKGSDDYQACIAGGAQHVSALAGPRIQRGGKAGGHRVSRLPFDPGPPKGADQFETQEEAIEEATGDDGGVSEEGSNAFMRGLERLRMLLSGDKRAFQARLPKMLPAPTAAFDNLDMGAAIFSGPVIEEARVAASQMTIEAARARYDELLVELREARKNCEAKSALDVGALANPLLYVFGHIAAATTGEASDEWCARAEEVRAELANLTIVDPNLTPQVEKESEAGLFERLSPWAGTEGQGGFWGGLWPFGNGTTTGGESLMDWIERVSADFFVRAAVVTVSLALIAGAVFVFWAHTAASAAPIVIPAITGVAGRAIDTAGKVGTAAVRLG